MFPVTAMKVRLHLEEGRPGGVRSIGTRPQRKPRGLECGDARQRFACIMGCVSLLLVIAILFVIWIAMVALSAGDLRMKHTNALAPPSLRGSSNGVIRRTQLRSTVLQTRPPR